MAYSKAHNEVKDMNIATAYERERVWTICVVFNPKRSQRVEQILKQQYEHPTESEVLSHAQRMALQSEQSIKVALSEKELNADPIQKVLSFWAFCFVNRLGDKCVR